MKRNCAFSLVELTLVIAIAAILAALLWPEYQRMVERARSVACMNNLRQIGIAVSTYLADNDNTFPFIEPNPGDPVYDPEYEAQPMLAELGPYGVTSAALAMPERPESGQLLSQPRKQLSMEADARR